MSVIQSVRRTTTSPGETVAAASESSSLSVGLPRRRLGFSGLLGGSALLLVGTTVVNLGNYLFNLILGRWLGPAVFSDLSLIVTLMLVLTLITATLQTVTAKYAATYAAGSRLENLGALRQWSQKWAWGLGGAVALGLIFGAPWLHSFFNTASAWPFVILGIGIPVYFAQGIDRGILQGQLRFVRLTVSYQAEMWVRLIVGIIAVAIGWSVNGAVGGLTLSFVATWLVARSVATDLPRNAQLDPAARRSVARYAVPVALALIGQILINNSDVLIVKRFFAPEAAGQYAALALIGRIVFFATWSVVMVLLPTVAQKEANGERHWYLLWLSVGLVLMASAVIVGGCWLWAPRFVSILFGSAYGGIAPLLWLYAIATSLYAVANVFVTYRLSIGQSVGGVLAVIAGIVQLIALSLFHDSLEQVILLQIWLMGGLVAVLFVVDMWLKKKGD